MDITKIDWSHLQFHSANKLMNINHSYNYTKHGNGQESIRRIFSNVEHTIDDYEKLKIEEMHNMIMNEGITLPIDWTTSDTLRYCYSCKFDIPKCLLVLKKHLEWRLNPETYILAEEIIQDFKKGIIYLEGHDTEFRPVIVINTPLISFKDPSIETNFMKGLGGFLYLIKKFTFVPGKIENWIIIIETGGLSPSGFPFGILRNLIEFTTTNFPCSLEKLYILNPSFGLNSSWNIIKSMLDIQTSAKICFINSCNIKELMDKIPIERLEKKYGGLLPNFTQYWPPKYIHDNPQMRQSSSNLLIPYNSDNNLNKSINTVYYDCDDSRHQNNESMEFQSFKQLNHSGISANTSYKSIQLKDRNYGSLKNIYNNKDYSRIIHEDKEYPTEQYESNSGLRLKSQLNEEDKDKSGVNLNKDIPNNHILNGSRNDDHFNNDINENVNLDNQSPLKASFSRKLHRSQIFNQSMIYEDNQIKKSYLCGFCRLSDDQGSPKKSKKQTMNKACNIF